MPFDAIKKLSGRANTPNTRTPQTEHPMPTALQNEQELWDQARAPLLQRYMEEEATPEVMREDIVETMRRFNLDLPRRAQPEIVDRPMVRGVASTSVGGFNESPY